MRRFYGSPSVLTVRLFFFLWFWNNPTEGLWLRSVSSAALRLFQFFRFEMWDETWLVETKSLRRRDRGFDCWKCFLTSCWLFWVSAAMTGLKRCRNKGSTSACGGIVFPRSVCSSFTDRWAMTSCLFLFWPENNTEVQQHVHYSLKLKLHSLWFVSHQRCVSISRYSISFKSPSGKEQISLLTTNAAGQKWWRVKREIKFLKNCWESNLSAGVISLFVKQRICFSERSFLTSLTNCLNQLFFHLSCLMNVSSKTKILNPAKSTSCYLFIWSYLKYVFSRKKLREIFRLYMPL